MEGVYEFDGYYYVDAVRVGTRAHWYPGARVQLGGQRFSRTGNWQAQDTNVFDGFQTLLIVMEESPRIVDMRTAWCPTRSTGKLALVYGPDSRYVVVRCELTEIKQERFSVWFCLGGVPLIESEVSR